MALNLSRMTLYALISSIEEDLRNIIKLYISEQPLDKICIDKELLERSKNRLEKDLGSFFGDVALSDLVDYFDLGDTYQVINSNNKRIPNAISICIKNNTRVLEDLIPIRNRVMHIRPLNAEDYTSVMSITHKFISEEPLLWCNTKITLDRVNENPSFVLSMDIKSYEEEHTNHNLPLPDFDETGLIGRSSEVEKIKELCYGAFPVISIVGEGGVGKTALALKVAYEILEDKNNPFDALVWVSSKTTQITANEIKDIKNAINDSMGIINEISSQIIGVSNSANNFEEIIEYLSTFKIILFIDNLETILDDNIRNFVGSLPLGSKIIITSRIGLGAFEYPVKLQGIDESYASQLMRILAKIRGVDYLIKLDEKTMRSYVNRMHRNPSYIKWFVSNIQTGASPELTLQNSGVFLEFCMSNVYDYLSNEAQLLTTAMQCAPGLRDIPELSYLTGFDSLVTQKSIQELMSTNMLSQSSKTKGASVKTLYQLSELARSYLSKHHKPTQTYQKNIHTKLHQLNSLFEKQIKSKTDDKYNPFNIQFRDKSDRVIVKMLKDVQNHVSKGQHNDAFSLITEAHKLAPDYFEVARVMAYFHQKNGNISDARSQYELAILLSPETPQLYYWFAKFLLHEEENIDGSIDNLEKAIKLDPESIEVSLQLSRCYMFRRDYEPSNKMIELIESKISDESEHHQKIYFDTKIQIRYRLADDLSEKGNYDDAMLNLEIMMDIFNEMEDRFRDLYMRKKLSKCAYVIQRIKRTSDMDIQERITYFEKWFDKERR
ncbi:TPA: NB-ARC domain-containing protein [Morganella morganii]